MVCEYIFDILKALEYLHSMSPQIIHRDIKPENILINKKVLQIADFGWSNENDNKEVRNTFCGTPDYLAPEMIVGSGHNEKLDMWTVGVLMFELLHGKPPFTPKSKKSNRRMQQREIEKNILKGNIEFDTTISANSKEVIISLLNGNKDLRPGAPEVLDFPFFAKKKQLFAKTEDRASDRSVSSNVLDNENKELKKKIEEMEKIMESKDFQIQKSESSIAKLKKKNQEMEASMKKIDSNQRGSRRFMKNGYNKSVGVNVDGTSRGGYFNDSLPKKSPERNGFGKNRGKKLELERLKRELKTVKETVTLRDSKISLLEQTLEKIEVDLKTSRSLNIKFFDKHKAISTSIKNFFHAELRPNDDSKAKEQLDFEEMFKILNQIFDEFKIMKFRISKTSESRSNLLDAPSTYTRTTSKANQTKKDILLIVSNPKAKHLEDCTHFLIPI